MGFFIASLWSFPKTLQHSVNPLTETLSILNKASKSLSRGNFLLFIPHIAWTNIIIECEVSHTSGAPQTLFAKNSTSRMSLQEKQKHRYIYTSGSLTEHTCAALVKPLSSDRASHDATAGPQGAAVPLPAALPAARGTCRVFPSCSLSCIGSPAIASVLCFPPSSPYCKMSPPAPTRWFGIIFSPHPLRRSASPSSASRPRADCLRNVGKMSWAAAPRQIALCGAAAGLCVLCRGEAG